MRIAARAGLSRIAECTLAPATVHTVKIPVDALSVRRTRNYSVRSNILGRAIWIQQVVRWYHQAIEQKWQDMAADPELEEKFGGDWVEKVNQTPFLWKAGEGQGGPSGRSVRATAAKGRGHRGGGARPSRPRAEAAVAKPRFHEAFSGSQSTINFMCTEIT